MIIKFFKILGICALLIVATTIAIIFEVNPDIWAPIGMLLGALGGFTVFAIIIDCF